MVKFVPPFMLPWRFQKQAFWTFPPSSFPWIFPPLNLSLHLCQRYRSMDHNLWPSYWWHELTDGRHLFISPPFFFFHLSSAIATEFEGYVKLGSIEASVFCFVFSVGETNRETKTETLSNSRKKLFRWGRQRRAWLEESPAQPAQNGTPRSEL